MVTLAMGGAGGGGGVGGQSDAERCRGGRRALGGHVEGYLGEPALSSVGGAHTHVRGCGADAECKDGGRRGEQCKKGAGMAGHDATGPLVGSVGRRGCRPGTYPSS